MIGHILKFSLTHRALVVLVVAGVATIGLYNLRNLPIDAVPDITNNQVQVSAVSGAMSPEEMEKQVTFPIETALAGIPGLESTRSISRNGFSQVTAVFDEDVDIYFARAQVNERLAEVRENLPAGVEPRMGAITTGLGEIYMWTVAYEKPDAPYTTPEGVLLQTEVERASYLRTVQDWVIRPQMKGVKGVAGVDAIGGYVQQYHVQPQPEKLIALGLGFRDIIEALERSNRSIGAGFIERNGESYVVRSDGRLTSAKEISDIVLTSRDGLPIFIRDVATVAIGKELRSGSASENGKEAVVGTALMLIGENSRAVAEAVDAKLKEINAALPEGIVAKPVLNRMKLVDATIATVEKNLLEGALLVILILFLLLGNFRAALITALVIPVSMLMTATGMIRADISGNLMSLGALDFGLIVDGAVIITENCLRRLAERQHHVGRLLTIQERLHEVMEASKEMIQPTVFGQAIIIMVYLPLLTFSGVEGKMFEPMAMTVIFALVSAFILSLTFVPAMIALFVTGRVQERESPIITKAKGRYAPLLEFSLKHPLKVLAGAGAGFLASLVLLVNMGQEFIPSLDEKDIAMHAMRIPSTGISQSQEMQAVVEAAVSTVPEVQLVFSKTGTAEMAADPMPPNVSDTFIILKDRSEWPDTRKSKAEVIKSIEAAVAEAPGNNYEFTQPIQMRFNELISGVRSDVAVKVYGDDFAAMEASATAIATVLQTVEGGEDVKVEQTTGLPFLEIKLKKDAIARYGLNVGDVLEVVQIAIGGREAGVVFQGDKRFDIVVRLPDRLREDLSALANLPIQLRAESGELDMPNVPHSRPNFVPLKQLAELVLSEGPNQISRENGKRRVVVQANVRGRDIGSFVAEARERIVADVKVPAGYWLEWGGQFKNLEEAKERLFIVVPACFFMIFMLLFFALGSVRQGLLVFSGIPLALTGGIVLLWLRDMPFSISAAVGFIALSGVAVLNGLVMVSSINQRVRQGAASLDAIREGALLRLRPVLMTALVASLGFVPMALATGAGAEVQKPLATVVIGGLVSATILTLMVLPALYKHFDMGRE